MWPTPYDMPDIVCVLCAEIARMVGIDLSVSDFFLFCSFECRDLHIGQYDSLLLGDVGYGFKSLPECRQIVA